MNYDTLLSMYRAVLTARMVKKCGKSVDKRTRKQALEILKRESINNRMLNARTEEGWLEALSTIPHRQRSIIANLIWWDFPLKKLAPLTTINPMEMDKMRPEEVAQKLYLCGYSGFRAVERSQQPEIL